MPGTEWTSPRKWSTATWTNRTASRRVKKRLYLVVIKGEVATRITSAL
jgi:hypothetical protein